MTGKEFLGQKTEGQKMEEKSGRKMTVLQLWEEP
jgi:hypothetical protein